MNDYFSEGRGGGGGDMHENDNDIINTSEVNDNIAKFENHPSIIKIKENVTHTTKFSFSICSLDEMNKWIKNLNTTKPLHMVTSQLKS